MIRAKFKRSAAHLVPYSMFILGVSMGSANHRGEALEAIVSCLNATHLSRGIVDVSDTLRRYSFMTTMNESAAANRARELGDRWLAENARALQALKADTRIVRWDDWLADHRFRSYKARFTEAYHNSPALRAAIAKDVRHFHRRSFNAAAAGRVELELSVQFYLEELAVMSIQFEDYPAAQVYPGRELACLKLVRSGMLPDIPCGIRNTAFIPINVYDDPSGPTSAPHAVF